MTSFFIAPFAVDGECLGVESRSLADLSPATLTLCRGLLGTKGAAFTCSVPTRPLRHVTVRFTSAEGVALVKYDIGGVPLTSAVALKGSSAEADAEVLNLFVNSLRQVPLVQHAAAGRTPFEAAFAIAQRPLYLVVSWGSPKIKEADADRAREFEIHLAASYLMS